MDVKRHQTTLLSIVMALLVVSVVTTETHDVIQISARCPSDPANETCLTLSSLAANASKHFTNSTTLILLDGYHILDTTLSIKDIPYLEINGSFNATITCLDSEKLYVQNIDQVYITSTLFVGCGIINVRSISQFSVDGSKFYGHDYVPLDFKIGMLLEQVSSARIESSSFLSSSGGAVHVRYSNDISIDSCKFSNNNLKASYSAVYIHYSSNITIYNSTFTNNTSDLFKEGTLYAEGSDITIDNCTFSDNSAGSTVYVYLESTVVIVNSTFYNNIARSGGAINSALSEITIADTTFTENNAKQGGAFHSLDCKVKIHSCTYTSNKAEQDGGAIQVIISGNNNFVFMLIDSTFTNNQASWNGGAISIGGNGEVTIEDSTFVYNNAIMDGGAISLSSGALPKNIKIVKSTFTDNNASSGGAIYFHNSVNILINNSVFDSNKATFDGGALYVKSCRNVIILIPKQHLNAINHNSHELEVQIRQLDGTDRLSGSRVEKQLISFHGNRGQNGGAIYTTDSIITVDGHAIFNSNLAWQMGGGIHTHMTSLTFSGNVAIIRNVAEELGGGIHAISSICSLTNGSLSFTGNKANRGGGVSLQLGSIVQVLKPEPEINTSLQINVNWLSLSFINNLAMEYGGAIYVTDDSTTCATSPDQSTQSSSRCFLQTEASYTTTDVNDPKPEDLNIRNTYFEHNEAKKLGNSLYGGLLDRCGVSISSEIRIKFKQSPVTSLDYIYNTTNIKKEDIASDPVQVLLCENLSTGTQNYTKGENFKLSLVAIDQIGNHIQSDVHSVLKEGGGFSKDGGKHLIKHASDICTQFTYQIFSMHPIEQLVLYAEGPCRDEGISKHSINITFDECTCPDIGFEHDESDTLSCSCKCTDFLKGYVSGCSAENQTATREYDSYTWISYCGNENLTQSNNSEDGYIIHTCPYDYCLPPDEDVLIDFSDFDSQCDFNRSGNLCGSCRDGLSLILGGSDCWECNNRWLALLIVFTIAGVVLVTTILVCNLTVATGTINGLIFYANIILTNREIFFPVWTPSFWTIFISWLNLDLGIKTCFFHGMDGYIKSWLQLAFPIYILLLVLLIIVFANYSQNFTRFLSGKNPVATLATLILLSYAKFVRTIAIILSLAKLKCYGTVWSFDGNVTYLADKHIYLFAAAIVIIFIGVMYTMILFLSRWVMHCPNRSCLCISTLKLNAFLETYSAPYKTNHHYWTALLLLARIVLYIISALSDSNQEVSLFAIIVIVIGLVSWKAITSRIYQQWSLDVLETSFFINLAVLAGATVTIQSKSQQHALVHASVGIAVVTFVFIVAYHTYKYVLLNWSICKRGNDKCELWFAETAIGQKISSKNRRVCFQESFTRDEERQGARDARDRLVTRSQLEISQRHTSVARRHGHKRGQNYCTFENQQEQVEDSQHNNNCEENKV